jgi:hypothetical protein
LSVAGVFGLVIGSIVVAASVLSSDGMCGLLVSCSARGRLGFVDAGGGEVLVLTGPVSGRDIDAVEVRTAAAEEALLWRLERTGRTPADWDGTVLLGEVPAGFAETAPLADDAVAGAIVSVLAACGEGFSAPVPTSMQEGWVTTSAGDRESITSFLAVDRGLPSCDADKQQASERAMWGGLAIALIGLAAVAAARTWRWLSS